MFITITPQKVEPLASIMADVGRQHACPLDGRHHHVLKITPYLNSFHNSTCMSSEKCLRLGFLYSKMEIIVFLSVLVS